MNNLLLDKLREIVYGKKEEPPRAYVPQLEDKLRSIVYGTSYDYYDKWRQGHRPFQIEAIEAIQKENLGCCFLPTGTGKTRIQIDLHLSDIIRKDKEGKTGIFVVGAHRLILCQQLLNEMFDVIIRCGIKFNVLFIGSSKQEESDYNDIAISFGAHVRSKYGTNMGEINRFVDLSRQNKCHVIVVSTYHSFNRMKDLGEIDVCTYDEAHTTIEQRFTRNILEVKPNIRKNYFFTATKKSINKFFGMANEEFYGKELFKRAPRQMIEQMEIVPPIYHLIKIHEDKDYSETQMLVKTILEGFEKHKTKVKQISSDPSAIGAKMLVTTNGTDELVAIYSDPHFIEYCQKNKIRVFAFSSGEGYYVDFQSRSRQRIITEMKELRDDEDAILLHIRILTEGIDLPAITGVMLLRTLDFTGLVQTIGRAMRLLKSDRRRYYSGEITSDEMMKFWKVSPNLKDPDFWISSRINELVKPCCFVIIPENYRHIREHFGELKMMIDDLYNLYEIEIDKIARDEKYTTEQPKDAERITEEDKVEGTEKESVLYHLIKDIITTRVQVRSRADGNPMDYWLEMTKRTFK